VRDRKEGRKEGWEEMMARWSFFFIAEAADKKQAVFIKGDVKRELI